MTKLYFLIDCVSFGKAREFTGGQGFCNDTQRQQLRDYTGEIHCTYVRDHNSPSVVTPRATERRATDMTTTRPKRGRRRRADQPGPARRLADLLLHLVKIR